MYVVLCTNILASERQSVLPVKTRLVYSNNQYIDEFVTGITFQYFR